MRKYMQIKNILNQNIAKLLGYYFFLRDFNIIYSWRRIEKKMNLNRQACKSSRNASRYIKLQISDIKRLRCFFQNISEFSFYCCPEWCGHHNSTLIIVYSLFWWMLSFFVFHKHSSTNDRSSNFFIIMKTCIRFYTNPGKYNASSP